MSHHQAQSISLVTSFPPTKAVIFLEKDEENSLKKLIAQEECGGSQPADLLPASQRPAWEAGLVVPGPQALWMASRLLLFFVVVISWGFFRVCLPIVRNK